MFISKRNLFQGGNAKEAQDLTNDTNVITSLFKGERGFRFSMRNLDLSCETIST